MQNVKGYDAEAEPDEQDGRRYQRKMPIKPVAKPPVDDVVRPLVISDAHASFELDKKLAVDHSLGQPNDRHVVC